MQPRLSHLQFNVQPANMPFYQDLMAFLGWQTIFAGDAPPDNVRMLGVSGEHGLSLWFVGRVNAAGNDYDGPGLNHLALGAASPADVDAVAAYLGERDVAPLFETPRHRPEFSQGADHTYYQVMFETPDRILLEVVYTGPKAA